MVSLHIASTTAIYLALTASAFGAGGADACLDALTKRLALSRSQLPAMTASAQAAAKRVAAGGAIHAGGPQARFGAEAAGRAGGLMAVRRFDRNPAKGPTRGDVVLFGAIEPPDAAQKKTLQRLQAGGVQIVVFGPKEPFAGLAPTVIDGGRPPGLTVDDNGHPAVIPIDSVINVVNLWAWTGEFVAACTRVGKMPVLYQSYGMPGGRDRAAKYRGKTFHDDMTIEPIPPGRLGRAYVDEIERELRALRRRSLDDLAHAARMLAHADDPVVLCVGHLFGDHFTERNAPRIGRIVRCGIRGETKETFDAGNAVLLIGYQQSPDDLIDATRKANAPLAYLTVQPGPFDSPGARHIPAEWPLPDGCVTVKGYDVPILPASGVFNAAAYWAIVAETHCPR